MSGVRGTPNPRTQWIPLAASNGPLPFLVPPAPHSVRPFFYERLPNFLFWKEQNGDLARSMSGRAEPAVRRAASCLRVRGDAALFQVQCTRVQCVSAAKPASTGQRAGFVAVPLPMDALIAFSSRESITNCDGCCTFVSTSFLNLESNWVLFERSMGGGGVQRFARLFVIAAVRHLVSNVGTRRLSSGVCALRGVRRHLAPSVFAHCCQGGVAIWAIAAANQEAATCY